MMGTTLHASCLVMGEAGILLRGISGSGKSRLLAELLVGARQLGWFARLVADDRVRVEARHGRLIARPVGTIAGGLEVRGLGLVRLDYEPAAVVRLVVEGSLAPARMPEAAERETAIAGIALPCLAAPDGSGRVYRVLASLCGLHDTPLTG